MSQIEEWVFNVVAASNGVSAIHVMHKINRDFEVAICRQQVSGALQRLRSRGLVEHWGGWTAVKP